MSKKTLLGISLAVALFGLAGCADESDSPAAEATASETAQPEAPAAELDNIPEVVAEVNGTVITGEEFASAYETRFEQYAAEAEATGQDLDQDLLKAQLADSMVDHELLLQEADRRQLSVTEEEIDAAVEELAAATGMETSDALGALAEEGLDEEYVRSQLEKQLLVDKLVADEAGDTTPSEAELRELYDALVGQQEQAGGEELPAFEDVRPQLESQVRSEKELAASERLISELRESGDVTIHLEQP